MAVKGKVAKVHSETIELLDVKAYMLLLFFERVRYAAPEGGGRLREAEEGVGHDLDGEEFVPGKAVQANGPLVAAMMFVEGREFFDTCPVFGRTFQGV